MRSAARRNIHVAVPGMENGNHQMRRRAEAEQADALAALDSGDAQAAKADDARAQQWRGVKVIKLGRQRIDEVAARDGILRVAAVDGVSGEGGRVAEVLEAAAAIGTSAVDAAHPGNADAAAERKFWPGAVFDGADDLMAGYERLLARRQFAIDDVKIGAADSAGADAEQNFAAGDLRLGQVFDLKMMFGCSEDGGFHGEDLLTKHGNTPCRGGKQSALLSTGSV